MSRRPLDRLAERLDENEAVRALYPPRTSGAIQVVTLAGPSTPAPDAGAEWLAWDEIEWAWRR